MISIGDNYKVGSDRYNIILYGKDVNKDPAKVERMNKMWEKRRGRPPKVEKVEDDKVDDENDEDKIEKGWRIEGYYSNIENCLNALVRIEVLKSDLKDLQTVLDRIDEAQKNITETLNKIPKEVITQSIEGKM